MLSAWLTGPMVMEQFSIYSICISSGLQKASRYPARAMRYEHGQPNVQQDPAMRRVAFQTRSKCHPANGSDTSKVLFLTFGVL